MKSMLQEAGTFSGMKSIFCRYTDEFRMMRSNISFETDSHAGHDD